MSKPIHVITGATSGLGFEVAKRLARRSGGMVIAGARKPEEAMDLKAALPPSQLLVLPLDTSSLASVRRFCDAVRERLGGEKIASITCIAGLQILGPAKRTEDGVDETFATNHLGHFALVRDLMDELEPGATVVTTGSGTENPDNPIAPRFGFLGASFPDAESVALGRTTRGGRPETLLALDRYATSKLCAILYALGMAERVPPEKGAVHLLRPRPDAWYAARPRPFCDPAVRLALCDAAFPICRARRELAQQIGQGACRRNRARH